MVEPLVELCEGLLGFPIGNFEKAVRKKSHPAGATH